LLEPDEEELDDEDFDESDEDEDEADFEESDEDDDEEAAESDFALIVLVLDERLSLR
jgi:ribonuclease E